MKIRFLITVFLSVNCFMFSQLPCPLQSGIKKISIPPESGLFRGCIPDRTKNRISSESNKVISLSDGKVSSILVHRDNTKSLLIRSDNDHFFIYSNLDKIFFNTKDKVEKDQILGTALPDVENEANFLLDFEFWIKTEPIEVVLNCKKPINERPLP